MKTMTTARLKRANEGAYYFVEIRFDTTERKWVERIATIHNIAALGKPAVWMLRWDHRPEWNDHFDTLNRAKSAVDGRLHAFFCEHFFDRGTF